MSIRALGCAVLFFTALLQSPAIAAGDPSYFCRLDNKQKAVVCVRTGDTVPAFEYRFQVTAPLSALLNLDDIKVKPGAGREQYRINLERFRRDDVEAFRSSLETFRRTVESMRAAKKIDLALYQQLMFMYSDLLLRFYDGGIRTYEQGIVAYRQNASYPTY